MQIKINVNLIDKNRLIKKQYTKKDGTEVSETILSLDTFDLKAPKILFEGDNYKIVKKGFVKQSSTKEEREGGLELPIIGDVIEYER